MLKSIWLAALMVCAAGPLVNKSSVAAVKTDVTLSGAAKTCFNTSIVPVGGVSVGFYDVKHARPLVAHLDSMANFRGFGPDGLDTVATHEFDVLESTMQRMAATTKAIARRTSAGDGSFSATISPVDSVLVLGYENMEDEPYVYAFKTMSGVRSSTFILDMSRGQCGL